MTFNNDLFVITSCTNVYFISYSVMFSWLYAYAIPSSMSSQTTLKIYRTRNREYNECLQRIQPFMTTVFNLEVETPHKW